MWASRWWRSFLLSLSDGSDGMSATFSVPMLRRIVRVHDLRDEGFSVDVIAADLGVAREMVVRYLKVARPKVSSPPDMSWSVNARCQGGDVDLFFPNEVGVRAASAKVLAAQLCAACPVQGMCRDSAEANYEQFGVWGGEDFSHRQYRFDKRSGEITVVRRVRRNGAFAEVG